MIKISTESNTKRITGKQLKLLWVLARQLGMTDELLHAGVLWATGKESIRELSVWEAKAVIDGLIDDGARVKKKRKSRRLLAPNIVELVTGEQLRFIEYLEKQLGWQDNPERLKGFIKRTVKKENVRTKQEGIKVIQGLKSMLARKPRKEVNTR